MSVPGASGVWEQGVTQEVIRSPLATVGEDDAATVSKSDIIYCIGCGQAILDKTYLQMAENSWHSSCLHCNVCGVPLHDQVSCYFKDGLVYCKEDYYRYTSRACAGCGVLIAPNDYILKARNFVYHLPCFICTTCRRALNPGERFSVDDETGRLHCCFCWKHCDEPMTSANNAMAFPSAYYDAIDKPLAGRKGKPGESILFPSPGEIHDLCRAQDGGRQKSKRIRTSFKHNQLRAMKNYFNINHNPDAKDLKQLAHETGLTKRVLQVWFQNARAKYRRGRSQKTISGEKEKSGTESIVDDEKQNGGENLRNGSDENVTQTSVESTSTSEMNSSENLNEYEKSWQEGNYADCITATSPSDQTPFSPNDSYSISPDSDNATSPWATGGKYSDSFSTPATSGTDAGSPTPDSGYTEFARTAEGTPQSNNEMCSSYISNVHHGYLPHTHLINNQHGQKSLWHQTDYRLTPLDDAGRPTEKNIESNSLQQFHDRGHIVGNSDGMASSKTFSDNFVPTAMIMRD